MNVVVTVKHLLGGYFYYRTSLRERGSNCKTLIGAGTFIIEPVYVNVVVTLKHLLGRVLLLQNQFT